MTSSCKIDEYGERSLYTLQIMQVSPKDRNKLGTWDPESGINYARNVTQINLDTAEFMANKTFIVSSKLVRKANVYDQVLWPILTAEFLNFE